MYHGKGMGVDVSWERDGGRLSWDWMGVDVCHGKGWG